MIEACTSSRGPMSSLLGPKGMAIPPGRYASGYRPRWRVSPVRTRSGGGGVHEMPGDRIRAALPPCPAASRSCSGMSMGLLRLVGDVDILGCSPVCLLSSPPMVPIGDCKRLALGHCKRLALWATAYGAVFPHPPTMKAVTCRGTLIQSAHGAPTHAYADETTASNAPMAPACGAVLAPATPLDGRDECVVDGYICRRAHGRSTLAGAQWAGASGEL